MTPPARESFRAHRLLPLHTVALVAFGGLAALWWEGSRLLADHRQAAVSEARQSGDQIARALEATNLALSWAAERLADDVAGREGTGRWTDERLAEHANALRFVGKIYLLDRSGQVSALSEMTDSPEEGSSNSDYFEAHRQGDGGLVVGLPEESSSGKGPSLPITKRITAPDGTFGGVAVAQMKLAWLEEKVLTSEELPEAALLLARQDGTILAAHLPELGGAQLRRTQLTALAENTGGRWTAQPEGGWPAVLQQLAVTYPLPGTQLQVVLLSQPLQILEAMEPVVLATVGAILLVAFIVFFTAARISRAQERHRRAEAYLRDAIGSIHEGFILIDPQHRLVTCNQRFLDLFPSIKALAPQPGTPIGPIIAAAAEDLDHSDLRTGKDAWIAGRWENFRTSPSGEQRVRMKDGRWVEMHDTRLPDGGVAGVRLDVTAQIATEERLRQAAHQAEAANRAKSTFLAIMSHELRTPMTSVLGMADLLLQSHLTEEQRRHIAALQAAARTLLTLLNDILDFSKIEAGELTLESIDFELRNTVSEVTALLAPTASQKGLALEVDAGQTAVWVRGDPVRLQQILFNLVGNAIKFSLQGTVRVTVEVRHGAEEEAIRLVCDDDGIGIPEAQRARLFLPFSQADASMARRFGGSGLGLAISRRLAEAMGGSISYEPREGGGSRFAVSLHLPRGQAPRALPAPDATEAPPRGDLRILLAEDNGANRLLIETFLSNAGHHVTAVENGVEAVERAAREEFDLILMDLQMPVMDGLEATRRIRALSGKTAGVPIIALTADAMPEHRASYLKAGLTEVLTKPIDWPQLFARLAALQQEDGVPPGTAEA